MSRQENDQLSHKTTRQTSLDRTVEAKC